MKVIVVSGGFDPLHSGHIEYFNSAKKYGDYLVVALNSDKWLKNKKGKPFMPFNERKILINNLEMVDEVIGFKDDDIGSCSMGLETVKEMHPNDTIIFCNGGDRNKENIPETSVSGVDFKFNVGGAIKKNSSSWLLKDYLNNFEEREWGKFYNLFKDDKVRIKELIIHAGKELSFQRHKYRNEIWFVSKGKCFVKYGDSNKAQEVIEKKLNEDETFHVPVNKWHQIINTFDKDCHIIEIQYGKRTVENDIERSSISGID
jgi:D-beta-D-heptose 7-phosphate kinase/D-beta-D-heptose 1-phosphate adenosyltransferase